MLIKTRGICLHTSKYAETSVIAQVYTEEKGLQSYIISGVRAPKPKVHASLLQPLTMLDMVAYWRPEARLFRTRELRALYTYQRIPFELHRGAVALFASDVLLKALRESEPLPDLFHFVEQFATYLDTTDAPLANLPTYFLLHMTAYLGVQPEAPNFGAPYYFDLTQGYFVPEPPDHFRYANAETSAFLVEMMQVELAEVHRVSTSREARVLAMQVLLDYLKAQLDRFGSVTSHRVLAEVLRA